MGRKRAVEVEEEVTNTQRDSNLLPMAASLISAYVRHNRVPVTELQGLVKSMYDSLAQLSAGGGLGETLAQKPMVPIKKSITDDYIICLEDGQKLKMLKRYLRTHFKLTPEEYRAKWGLPHDYPMVAPNYARLRSAFAKKSGLGRIPDAASKERKRLRSAA